MALSGAIMAAQHCSERLLDFFRKEFQHEERQGFPRLSRVPSTFAIAPLAHYRSLNLNERLDFIDCCACWAVACFGFVVGVDIDHKQHPYYQQWSHAFGMQYSCSRLGVPLERACVQQYKVDARRGVASSVSVEDFQRASSVLARSVKAPELRKRVREALRPYGYRRTDHLGYWCRHQGHEFCVHVSYGGARAHHQLKYGVVHPELSRKPIWSFENALGFVMGDYWDYIVEETVNDSMSLFAELVGYSLELPDRIRAAAA